MNRIQTVHTCWKREMVFPVYCWTCTPCNGHTLKSHHLTVEARDKPAITSLRLIAVLTVLSWRDAEPKSPLVSVTPKHEPVKLHP